MSYTPQVGDRVKVAWWGPGSWVDVKCIQDGYLIGFAATGRPFTGLISGHDQAPWVKVEPRPELPELPEVWLPLVRLTSGKLHCSLVTYRSSEEAMRNENNVVAVKCTPDPDSVVWADEVRS